MGLGDLLRRGARRAGPDGPPPPGPLADLAAAPVAPEDTPLAEVELLALDLETTGLDPRRHEVLAVGWVPVRGDEIDLSGAGQHLVRPRGEVGESAVLHGLTDDALRAAPPLAEVLPQVLEALAGAHGGHRRVLLAHFARIETDFLDAACREHYGTTVTWPVVDTLEMARRLLRLRPEEVPAGRLRLAACRRAYRLPRYRAHSAVTDALACAELFLAQQGDLAQRRDHPLLLGDVLERRRP